MLEDYDPLNHARRTGGRAGGQAYDEDEEGEEGGHAHGPGGVQCQTQ